MAQEPDAAPVTTTTSTTRRVLTVGDGNFSYSLALIKARTQGVHLTATSFDSYAELVTKYPESARIVPQLRNLGVTVLHRVDATNIHESLLSASDGQYTLSPKFDIVVFNHPHCGEENVQRHQSLLSHFYASALEVLDTRRTLEDSGIHLTLAEGQSDRWQAVSRAHTAGLKLVQQVDDVDNDGHYGLEYERKRHQNGKSFHQVTLHGEKRKQVSTLFIFRRQEGEEDNSVGNKEDNICTKDTTTRKRKAERELKLTFACDQCEKSFKSAQGLRTHVHMVHELEAGASTKVLMPCEFCDRTFTKEDARRQHQLAKHGKDQLIKPDWYENQTTSKTATEVDPSKFTLPTSAGSASSALTASVSQAKTCSICQLSFSSEEEFDAHWQKLQPRAAAKRKCSNCNRDFDEERALRQHYNFCVNTIEALTK